MVAKEAAVEDAWPEVRPPGSGRSTQASPAGQDVDASAPTDHVDRGFAQAPGGDDASSSGSHVGESRAADGEPSHAEPSAARANEQESGSPDGRAPAAAGKQSAGDTANSFDIAEVRRQWRGVVDQIKKSSRATAALVETATPVTVRGSVLVLTAPPALVRRLADPHQNRPLQAALQEVLGVQWSIEVTDGQAGGAAGGPPSEAAGPAPGGRTAAPPPNDDYDEVVDPDDEVADDPRASLDPGEAAVSLLRDELGAEEIGND